MNQHRNSGFLNPGGQNETRKISKVFCGMSVLLVSVYQ